MKYLQHVASRHGRRLGRRPELVGTIIAISGVALATASRALSGFDVPGWLVVLLVVAGGVVAVIEIVAAYRQSRSKEIREIRRHVRWFDGELPEASGIDPLHPGERP